VKALVLRNCKADLTSHSGFTYPEKGPVEAPDWNSRPECGGGLHGLIWGEGNWSLLRPDFDAKWQVIEVEDSPENIVRIDAEKIKFHRGEVIFTGEMSKAVTMVLCGSQAFQRAYEQAKDKAEGDSSKAASSGYSSTAASSGDSSKAASSGNSSTAASSGDSSTAEAKGEKTIAMVAGIGGTARAGKDGCFALAYLSKSVRPRIVVGHVGEKGIKADVWYCVKNGKLVKA
jgi:hypothetical protein